MATKYFKANKLGSDNVHELFNAWDMTAYTRELSPEEFKNALFNKLNEETLEVVQTPNSQELKEEIGDVLEVLHAIADVHNIAWNDIETARMHKRKKKGGYKKRLLIELIEMDETNPRYVEFKHKPGFVECSPEINDQLKNALKKYSSI